MNKFICAAFLLATATLAIAYNFEDSDFNEILANDFEDYFTEPELPSHRTRRDEDAQKCKRKHHFKVCCGEEAFEEQLEKDKELKKECFKQVTGKDREPHYFRRDPFKCENVEQRKKEITCVTQCVTQKKGLADSDGNIKVDAFKAHMKEVLSKADWLAPMADAITEKCLKEATAATPTAAPKEADACNPAPLKIARCLFKETQLACPADKIKDEKFCNKLKDRLKKNEDLFASIAAQADEDN